jgi:selenocysteine lyase/cysteine desulfurase
MTPGTGERLSLEEARTLFAPETTYLNTASFGLPPRPAWDALQAALGDWRGGRTSWERWGDSTEAARAAFAELVGVPVERVAVGANVSSLVGLVAASLPDGARVLSTEPEFTSVTWPFLAQGRGIEVDFVPVDRLAEAVEARTDVVAFSAAQSATGEVADLDAVAESADHHGAMTVVDASQACGWLPLDAARFDVVACTAYKWLLSPRGTAFLTVAPERLGGLVPHAAGWYAAEDVHGSYYGTDMRLAAGARRFDVSPAWFSWVGTAPAVDVILRVGVQAIHDHDVRLANLFREGLGMDPSDSAIVSAEVAGAEERLAGSGVMAAARAGSLRTAWHLYNTEHDVARVLALLR